MTDSVTLPRQLLDDLLRQARSEPEHEICGLIPARHGKPCGLYPVANVSSSPRQRFEMDPRGQIDAMRSMREKGESLFAIYHSHPQGAAVPSAIDLEQAAYPEALYLIIAPDIRGIDGLRGYRMDDGGFREIELRID